jgi:hypothetical protein
VSDSPPYLCGGQLWPKVARSPTIGRAISLALGREPTFPPRRGRDPETMVDFDDDDGPWTPYFVNSMNCPPSLVSYVYQPSRRVATFRYLGRLCLVSIISRSRRALT